jgi:hypothetical protein
MTQIRFMRTPDSDRAHQCDGTGVTGGPITWLNLGVPGVWATVVPPRAGDDTPVFRLRKLALRIELEQEIRFVHASR